MILPPNPSFRHKMITANPCVSAWSPVVSVNCSDPFASFFCSFCQSVKIYLRFCVKAICTVSRKAFFPFWMRFVCFSRHSRWKPMLPLSLLPLSGRNCSHNGRRWGHVHIEFSYLVYIMPFILLDNCLVLVVFRAYCFIFILDFVLLLDLIKLSCNYCIRYASLHLNLHHNMTTKSSYYDFWRPVWLRNGVMMLKIHLFHHKNKLHSKIY